jgi:hypothetical protein
VTYVTTNREFIGHKIWQADMGMWGKFIHSPIGQRAENFMAFAGNTLKHIVSKVKS